MQVQKDNNIQNQSPEQIKLASNCALASLLNLTFLPVLAFVYLIIKKVGFSSASIEHYHALFAIKLNLLAALSLGLGSFLMLVFGGFDSPLAWAYVVSYFTLVHTGFILVAVWVMVRAWSGQKIKV